MREKRDRNNSIIQEINRGEYLVDIAKKYNISSAMVSKIKKRYFDRLLKANPDIPDLRKFKKKNKGVRNAMRRKIKG